MFKPYSPEIRGDLLEYLRSHDGGLASNLFRGSKYFFVIRDLGLMIPEFTSVRVDQSFVPDIGYIVNEEFLLRSDGHGEPNMSWMGAKEGVYDPLIALRNLNWSIYNLKLWDEI